MSSTSVTGPELAQLSQADAAYVRIVEAVQAAVGRVPVILGGSRATGQHTIESDYDVVVVLAMSRVPLAIRSLAVVARSLSAELGAHVAINPLPASRLKRFDRNLFLWKLCREGLLLDAPPGFRLPSPSQPITSDLAAVSYLLSAALYLIEDLDPAELRSDELPPARCRSVRKALLHVVQVDLFRQGRHAAGLEAALGALGSCRLRAVAETSRLPGGWFGVRRELLRGLGQRSVRSSLRRSVSRNLQYAVLSSLRGKARWWALAATYPVERSLAEVILALLCAVEPGGDISAPQLQGAVSALPVPLRPPAPSWSQLRDVVVTEWKSAHPLLSL